LQSKISGRYTSRHNANTCSLSPWFDLNIYLLLILSVLFFKDFNYPNPSSSAGDSFNRGKYPSRYPSTSESIFEYLCGSVDNDYTAHPTDCKRYAYCANGKKT
jgi:hypothetical protein